MQKLEIGCFRYLNRMRDDALFMVKCSISLLYLLGMFKIYLFQLFVQISQKLQLKLNLA